MSLMCLFFGHRWGPWKVSMSGGYEKRHCDRCGDFEMQGRGDRAK